ncbi:hypothetical protein AB990_01515 [Alkalihalobacillus pseudalcaliphilus]|nr:hypothetical protein AB990_01515 [Alkalihalobacillus pseudalcaliphilus]
MMVSILSHDQDIHTNTTTIAMHQLYEQAIEVREQIHSEHVYLLRLDDEQVIYEKNAYQETSIASLTKMMTTLVAAEKLENEEVMIRIDEDMFEFLRSENLSVAGFLPNEEVNVMDLIYGVMLPSGAEASLTIAQYIAGSEEAFVQLMNEKAQALNMNATRFTNVTGMDAAGHYSTVFDMSLLLKAGLENPLFKKIIETDTHATLSTNLREDGISFRSTMFMMIDRIEQSLFKDGEIRGGKTGFTDAAGLCLASFATIDGRDYILITAGADASNRHLLPLHTMDAIYIYDHLTY